MAIARLLQLLIACLVIGSMAVALTISFAALIYAGPLSAFLGQGIALTLLGGAVMALVGSFAYSIRGVICNPQDITAVLIGSAASGFAGSAALAGDALFATVLALVVTSSLFTGLVVFFAGVLRLGALIRYIPYPVIAGFLASTGYLLLMGGLGIVAQESVSIFNLAEVLGTLSLARWLPWILGGLALAIAAQRMPGDLLVPSALCVATAMFFAVLTLQGLTMNEALSTGLLLGPFEQARLGDTLTRDVARDIDWSLILMAAPTLLAIAGLTLLGSLLNTTGLAITLDQPSDTEQDMRATGLSNIAAAFAGGPPGYVILGESILAHRMGLRGIAPGLVAAAACAGAVIAGTGILAYIPAGLMAMLVSYLGFDLLDSWLWQSRRRLTRFEYGVVLLIFAIAATLGFLQALAIGTLAAAGIFIVSYARTEVVRSRSTLATRRSRVERPEEELALLARAGEHCVILELSGHLFFGTADRFAKLLKGEIESDAALHHLIIDFRRVSGIDASAAVSLIEVLTKARAAQVKVILAGMSDDVRTQYLQNNPPENTSIFAQNADTAMQQVEDLLVENEMPDGNAQSSQLMQIIARLEADYADQPETIQRINVAQGEALLTRGDVSNEFYVLVTGALRAEIEIAGGQRLRVAEFRPCAMIGEIAYYAGVARTAWVVADVPSQVVRVDMSRMETAPTAATLDFHKAAARSLARRVMRMTELTREAEA